MIIAPKLTIEKTESGFVIRSSTVPSKPAGSTVTSEEMTALIQEGVAIETVAQTEKSVLLG